LLAVILVVVMCVFVTVVELAVATSKETSRARLHSNVEILQAEGAIVDAPVGSCSRREFKLVVGR
jgi:hypothetical protein